MPSPFAAPRNPGIRVAPAKGGPTGPQFPWAGEPRSMVQQDTQLVEEVAQWGRGDKYEYIVWKWLTQTKRLKEGVDFMFQSSVFGGRRMFGGMVTDFWIIIQNAVWRVQGERFHLLNTADRVRDMTDRVRLEHQGTTVIDLWVRDLDTRPTYVLEKAWAGQEVQNSGI